MRLITIIIIFILTLLLSCRKEESNMETSLMEASKQELADAIEERDRLIVLVKEISENIEDVRQMRVYIHSAIAFIIKKIARMG